VEFWFENSSVGLLDVRRQLLGERRPCRVSWEPGPGSWLIRVREHHIFELESLPSPPAYVAIYENNDLAMALRLPGGPQDLGGILSVG
jgi:hypothetical protein